MNNMNRILTTIVIIATLTRIGGAETLKSSGLSLLAPSAARPSGLSGAFTAAADDIGAFHYNPASLGTLSSNQLSFFYRRGALEDAQGNLMVGVPTSGRSTFGVAVNYYNGGDLVVLNDDLSSSKVTAQKDIVGSIGYALTFGRTKIGLASKYISSELADRYTARSVAFDLGAHHQITKRLSLGAALQNMGGGLRYSEKKEKLPRVARIGLAAELLPRANGLTLFLDAPYMMNEKDWQGAAGLEAGFGPLALRGGYKTGKDDQRATFGAGFLMGSMTLDYAFQLASRLDSQHLVSVSLRFGDRVPSTVLVNQKPDQEKKDGSERIGDRPSVDFPNQQ